MAQELSCVVAGFGGQGSLFAGKVIATAGLIEDREVSWMPSYGPEMRGGTANCSVTLADEPIGSPLVLHPNALIGKLWAEFPFCGREALEGALAQVAGKKPAMLEKNKIALELGMKA